MIGIYTQGSENLGLGHLSRVVPLYHYLIDSNFEVSVHLHGDELGKAYLEYNKVECVFANKFNVNVGNDVKSFTDLWIIDSTRIWDNAYYKIIQHTANRNILLSPKFEKEQLHVFHTAFLRSDPFHLSLQNKKISSENFFFNDGKYVHSNNGLHLGIALSGGSTSKFLKELVEFIINDTSLNKIISSIKIFTGGSGNFIYERKGKNNYSIEITTIDSLRSLWQYVQGVDLMIVGNGIIVDECIHKNMDFIIYDTNKLGFTKSMNNDVALSRYTSDLTSLKMQLLKNKNYAKKKIQEENVFKKIVNSFNANNEF